MRHLLALCLVLMLAGQHATAADKVALIPTEANAWGETRRDATVAALAEAVAQVNGRAVAASSSMKRASVEVGVDDESSYAWREELASEVADAMRGVVDSYEILSVEPDGSGWLVTVKAMVARLVSDGSRRKPLAVIPFTAGRGEVTIFGQGWDRTEASRILTQLIVDKVTGTRRFAVIDREFVEVTQAEASLKVANPLTPMTQLLELANRMVAEYMIVGQLESVTATRTSNYIEIQNREIFTDSAVATVTFRVIDVGSDQVKYAGTDVFSLADGQVPKSGGATAVGTRILEVAAEQITEAMINAIYPILLVAIDGELVTLNQGGDTIKVGNIYELYRYGEKIVDPYTRESLGRSETLVGEVTVERVNPKTSLARLTNLETEAPLEFSQKAYVLRLKNRQLTSTASASAAKATEITESIEQKKQKSDENW
jgi:hypothetical protein